MFKQLQTLVSSVKEVQPELLLTVIRKGVSLNLKKSYLAFIRLQIKVAEIIVKIKTGSEMKNFILNERDKHLGVMAKINFSEFPEFTEVSMELRRQIVMQGMPMPGEIHLYSDEDPAGLKHPKYILYDVKEGSEGLKVEEAIWVNDGRGKVYSYIPIGYTTYLEYVMKLEKHPFKKGCEDLNDKLKIIDLKKNY